MATPPKVMAVQREPSHASLTTYVTGFLCSLYLTIFGYIIVTHHVWGKSVLLWMIAGLALIQFFVQVVCFLHLGTETKPRWKLLVFGSMIVVVLILVFGSIWIMDNLNYHTMTPDQLKTYMQANEGL